MSTFTTTDSSEYAKVEIAPKALQANTERFLKSKSSEELFERETTPLWLGLGLTLITLGIGAVLVCTLVGTFFGIKLVSAALRGKLLGSNTGNKFRRNMTNVRGLIGAVIISGPESGSERPQRASLILGSFSDVPPSELAILAKAFGQIYSGELTGPNYTSIAKTLKDDAFSENRRREVPAEFSRGHRLWFFDLMVDPNEVRLADEQAYVGMIATTNHDWAALQVPWSVVESAVSGEVQTMNLGQTEPPMLMSMIHFDSRIGQPSLDDIREEIAGSWLGSSLNEAEDSETVMSFDFGDDGCVFLGNMPAPVPWSDLQSIAEASWLWPDAAKILKSHDTHAIVTMTGGQDPIQRVKLMTQVIASVLKATPSALGVYSHNARFCVSSQVFQSFAEEFLPSDVPLTICVNIRTGQNKDGTSMGFTRGLDSLGLMDLECSNANEPASELRARMEGIASYLLENGLIIRDGHTLGETAKEIIRVKYASSKYGHEKDVMQLDYSDR